MSFRLIESDWGSVSGEVPPCRRIGCVSHDPLHQAPRQ